MYYYFDSLNGHCCLHLSCRVNGLTKSPFGQTSVRFKESKTAGKIPGPGAYDDVTTTSMSGKLNRDAM